MGCMRRMPRISVGSFASVAHPAWRKIKNIDSGVFRRFGFEARLLKKLGFLIWKHIYYKMCVSL